MTGSTPFFTNLVDSEDTTGEVIGAGSSEGAEDDVHLSFRNITDMKKVCYIQLIRETLSKKKHKSARDNTERWSREYTRSLHIDLEKMYKFVFLHVKDFVFRSRGLFSVALLLLSHVFLCLKFF